MIKKSLIVLFSFVILSTSVLAAGTGNVSSFQKISDTEGGFTGTLDDNDIFGFAAASLGDLDGDGVTDIAVGAFDDDDGGTGRGAVYILFLNSNGSVKSEQKISDTEGSFTGTLDNDDRLGISVASLGDLDGDGVTDIAVGATLDDDGSTNRGAVYILFLNSNGSVKSEQKISDTAGGFTGTLDDQDQFGTSVASLGDLDGDGIPDIAVGAGSDQDGGEDRGAVWILFLDTDGTVKSFQKISDLEGGFTGTLDNFDIFGISVASLGDLDGDGVTDIVVGARNDDDGNTDRGAVWILFLDTDGTVKSFQKISDTAGGFTNELADSDLFGISVASLGDLDGDGVTDIVVGTRDDDGGTDRGAVYILFLNSSGGVKSNQKISDLEGDFAGTLDDVDEFGISVVSLGDLDGDGITDIMVASHVDDDGGTNRGAVYILFMNGTGNSLSQTENLVSGGSGTDLSSLNGTELQSVSNYVFESLSNGVIRWKEDLNFSNANVGGDNSIDNDITFGDGFVSIDSIAATAFAGKSANITFLNKCSICNGNDIIFVSSSSGSVLSTKALVQAGQSCSLTGVCSNFVCTGEGGVDCTFDVTGFSGFTPGGSANLTINDSAEGSSVATDTAIDFFAFYVNSTSGATITPSQGGNCNVTFDDSSTVFSMTFNGTGNEAYNFTKGSGFSTAGTHLWNVTCAGTDFSTLLANDTVDVTSDSDIPEFSDYALILALVITICGFFFVRRRE